MIVLHPNVANFAQAEEILPLLEIGLKMHDFIINLVHLLYQMSHNARCVLFPSFSAKRYKLINLVIGKVMSLKLNRVTTVEGISLCLDKCDSLALSYNRVYEPEETLLIKNTIKSGMRVIDIGANIGYYTTIFSKLTQDGFVHSFEPDNQNFKILQKNCQLNKCRNVKLHNRAAGNCDSLQKLYLSDTNHGDHRSYPVGDNRDFIEIKMVTIDNFLKSESNFDFIKMDIQGFEMNALEGIKNTLLNSKPMLLMEIWPEALIKNNTHPSSIIAFLRKANYNIYDVENLEECISLESTGRWLDSIKNHTNIYCTKKT